MLPTSKAMYSSRARCALIYLFFLATQSLYRYGSLGFAPPSSVRARKPPAMALRYKSKDLTSIANEIVDLEGDNARKSTSHDRNPWRSLLHSKHPVPPDDPAKLAGMLRSQGETRPTPVTIESLQHDLFSLFQIAQQLTATELELASELADLQRERSSIRRLTGRIFSLTKERLVDRVRRVLRLAPKKKDKVGT